MNLFQELEEQCKIGVRCGSTWIITIDGRAGSGKTTLASDLKLHLSARYQVEILHLDEVYNGWNDALGEHLTITLARVLESIKKKRPVVLQIYNWQLDIFDSEKRINSSEVLIIEGVGSGQRMVRDCAALTIWMEIPAEIGLTRVLERDGDSISAEMLDWQAAEDQIGRAHV